MRLKIYWKEIFLLISLLSAFYQFLNATKFDPVLFSNLTNDDVLLQAAFYRDLFIDHIDISGWSLGAQAGFFPELPLTFLANFLSENQMGGVILTAFFLWMGIFAGLLFLRYSLFSEDEKPSLRDSIFSWSVFLSAISLLIYASSEYSQNIFSKLFSPTYHVGTFISFLFVTSQVINFACTMKRTQFSLSVNAVVIFLTIAATSASDRLFLIYLPPLLLAVFTVYQFKFPRINFLYILITASAYFGYRLLQLLNYFFIIEFTEPLSSTEFSLQNLIKYTINVFHQIHFFHRMITLVLIFVLSVFLYAMFTGNIEKLKYRYLHSIFRLNSKNERQRMTVFAILVLLLIPFNVFISQIANRSLYPVNSDYIPPPRYLIFVYASPFLFLPVILEKMFLSKFSNISRIAAIALILAFSIAPLLYKPVYSLKEIFSNRPQLARCLDDHYELLNSQYGLGDYWTSKSVTLFSKKGIRVNPLSYNLTVYYWYNNLNWYFGKTKFPDYGFIMTNGLHREEILKRFGDPSLILDCGHEVFVYNRKTDESVRNFFNEKNLRLWIALTGRKR